MAKVEVYSTARCPYCKRAMKLIAWALTRENGVPHDPLLLSRGKRTPALRGMSPRQRREAVRAAFTVTRPLDAAHVVLVDDVYTSGATADACTRPLLTRGAAKVTILSWARVVGDSFD